MVKQKSNKLSNGYLYYFNSVNETALLAVVVSTDLFPVVADCSNFRARVAIFVQIKSEIVLAETEKAPEPKRFKNVTFCILLGYYLAHLHSRKSSIKRNNNVKM